MIRVSWKLALVFLGSLASGCAAFEDAVFEATLIKLVPDEVRVVEQSGLVQIPIRLDRPAPTLISAVVEIRGVEAQDDCQTPDFEWFSDTVEFPAGADETRIELWINDDNLAETDERLEVALTSLSGATLLGRDSVTVVIEDDDRDALLDASEYGVASNTGRDQSASLQRAFDAAADAGRGVVVVPPGDYEVSSVILRAGTSLSARGARFLRPPNSELGSRNVSVVYDGNEDSAPTLLEGLSVDGRRESQGDYQDYQRQDDHLIMLDARSEQVGRLVASVEDVRVTSGTGDGVAVGPNTDAALCRITAHDIWRDAISLHGGRSDLKVRWFDATADLGTSGIWLDGDIPGYQESRTVNVEIEDARLNTGDIEVSVADGSQVVLRRLSMTEPPFRVRAPDSSVEVLDSVIQIGVPSTRHNIFTFIHDVSFVNTTVVTSERLDELAESEEMDREFATFSLRWTDGDIMDPPPGEHQLTLDGCHLTLDDDIESTDRIFGVENPGPPGTVVVRASTLDPGFAGWFAPDCVNCTLEP